MRILCAIGTRRGREVVQEVSKLTHDGDEVILFHVIETGPRHDLDRLHGPLHAHHYQKEVLDTAEQETARTILKEALQAANDAGLQARAKLQKGRPEQAVVSLAAELAADLVVVCARETPRSRPEMGPSSVGRVARFVLDHSPAHVLLLRERPLNTTD